MKRLLIRGSIVAGAVALILAACSELKQDILTPVSGGPTVHQAAWGDTASPTFHGKALLSGQASLSECASCHSGGFSGGTSGISCFTCHSSYPHRAAFAGGGHQAFLFANGFPLRQCQSCHGASYTGGSVVQVSCEKSGCHVDATGAPKSPETCNSCHGTFDAPANLTTSWAPPRDLAGDTDETFPGVGAHQAHFAPDFARPVDCSQCHVVPTSVFDHGHIGSRPYAATLTFNTLARTASADGHYVPNPVYNRATHSCNNVFCHGSWQRRKSTSPYPFVYNPTDTVIAGEYVSPVFTGGATQASCGSCHLLPPRGHKPAAITECVNCHGDVIDATGNISDPTKHINGKINIRFAGTDSSFEYSF